jgi:hypothetical protein
MIQKSTEALNWLILGCVSHASLSIIVNILAVLLSVLAAPFQFAPVVPSIHRTMCS